MDDQLKARAQQHKARRDSVQAEVASLQQQQQSQSPPLAVLTPKKIEYVSRVLHNRLTASTPYAKAYLKATLREIRVKDDMMRLSGSRSILANLAVSDGQIDPMKGIVPCIVPKWLPGTGSNRRPSD